MPVRFAVNGEAITVDEFDPQLTLLEWLRGAGRTGTKEGCAEGECGACAVALFDRDVQDRGCFIAINSCLVPLASLHGRSLVTVEGVAAMGGKREQAALHPVQRALVEHGGSQCGYCTPGFVVSLFCEYYRPGRDGYDPEAISGNLCRCTGYRPIIAAAQSLCSPAPDDPALPLLAAQRVTVPHLEHRARARPSRFVRPSGLRELLEHFATEPSATLIAGGTDLMVYANQRYQRFDTLLALEGVPELQRLEVTPSEIVIGASLPLSRLARALEQACPGELPLLAQLWPLFSSRLIRNRATLGGNLGTASPIGDAPPALLALDAELTLASVRGERRLPAHDFFLGYRRHALEPGELILRVHLPRRQPRFQRFYKVSKRVLDDIATVAGAFALELSASGEVTKLRAAYGGIAATPLRAAKLEQAALGKPWNAATLQLLSPHLLQLGTPQGDHRGSAAYRRAMIGKLFEKFFAETAREASP